MTSSAARASPYRFYVRASDGELAYASSGKSVAVQAAADARHHRRALRAGVCTTHPGKLAEPGHTRCRDCLDDVAWRDAASLHIRKRARKLRMALVADGTVTAKAKWRHLEEYGEVCCLCGLPCAEGDLVWAHMTALARGGVHSMTNLAPAHAACNARQHTRSLEEYAEELVQFDDGDMYWS
jgi:5-methylcytosine-specific restriction endonuclease McrA